MGIVNQVLEKGWCKYYSELTFDEAIEKEKEYGDVDEPGFTKDIVIQIRFCGMGTPISYIHAKNNDMDKYNRLLVMDTGMVVRPKFKYRNGRYIITGEAITIDMVEEFLGNS